MKIKIDDENESWLRSKGKPEKDKPEKGKPEKGKKKPKKAEDASLALRVASRVLRNRVG